MYPLDCGPDSIDNVVIYESVRYLERRGPSVHQLLVCGLQVFENDRNQSKIKITIYPVSLTRVTRDEI